MKSKFSPLYLKTKWLTDVYCCLLPPLCPDVRALNSPPYPRLYVGNKSYQTSRRHKKANRITPVAIPPSEGVQPQQWERAVYVWGGGATVGRVHVLTYKQYIFPAPTIGTCKCFSILSCLITNNSKCLKESQDVIGTPPHVQFLVTLVHRMILSLVEHVAVGVSPVYPLYLFR